MITVDKIRQSHIINEQAKADKRREDLNKLLISEIGQDCLKEAKITFSKWPYCCILSFDGYADIYVTAYSTSLFFEVKDGFNHKVCHSFPDALEVAFSVAQKRKNKLWNKIKSFFKRK